MKTILFALFLTAAAAQTSDAPLAGKWQVHTSIAGNEVDQDCEFAQKGGELTGTCVSPRGKVEIQGKADGTAVTWSYKSEHDGTPLVVVYKGTLDAEGKMKGGVSVEAFGVEGEFTAARPK